MRRWTPIAFAAMLGAAGLPATTEAQTRPPLSEVAEIHDGLLAVGIADEIRNKCSGISARMISAFSYLNRLKGQARALGYSDKEIESYVTSKSEKRKMRAEGEAWLQARGATPGVAEGYCRVGREEIARGSRIGLLLREN